jgi:hypothetical protein
VSSWRRTNQAIRQITNDGHQELLEICDIRLAYGRSSTMDNFVERIKQTNYQVLGSAECLVSANNFDEQSQWLEFVNGE